MKRTLVAALVVVGLAAPAFAQNKPTPPVAGKELLRWKGKSAKLFVRNINGPLEVVGVAAGAEMEVVAIADGTGDTSQLKVEAHVGKNSLTVCAMYPGYQTTCGPDGRHDATGNGNSSDKLGVKFVVKLPKGAPLDVEMVNGDIVAKGLAADAEIETVNGKIVIAQENGKLDIETVNGDIQVATGAAGNCDVETVNGSVEIKLSGGADVNAETVNGRIDIGGERFDREARKTIGKGGRRVDIETVNGAIRVQ